MRSPAKSPPKLHEIMRLVNIKLSPTNLARLRTVSKVSRSTINSRSNLAKSIENRRKNMAEIKRLKNHINFVRFFKALGWSFNSNNKSMKRNGVTSQVTNPNIMKAVNLLNKYPTSVNRFTSPMRS